MNLKKAQSSLEFVIIFLFFMIVFAMLSYVMGQIVLGLQEDNLAKDRNNFAQRIVNEFETYNKLEGGFTREVLIERTHVQRFNLTFFNDSSPYFYIEDNEGYEDNSFVYYYDIPGEPEFNKTYHYYVDENDTGHLQFFKEYSTTVRKIELN